MKTILYKDGNNNASFLRWIFFSLNEFVNGEFSWSISNLNFVVVYTGDFFQGIIPVELEEIYNFQKETFDNYTVSVTHSRLINLLGSIQTIYEGDFLMLIKGKQLKIKVFDGDIIEIDGYLEDYLLNSLGEHKESVQLCSNRTQGGGGDH